MLARSFGSRRVLLQIAFSACRVAYRSELPGGDACKPSSANPNLRGQSYSQVHDPRDAGRGAVKESSTWYPL